MRALVFKGSVPGFRHICPAMSIWRHSENVFAFRGKGDYPRRMGSTRCQRDCDGGCGRQSGYRGGHARCRSPYLNGFLAQLPIFLLAIIVFAAPALAQKVGGAGSAGGGSGGGTSGGSGGSSGTLHSTTPIDTTSGGYNSGISSASSSQPNPNPPNMDWDAGLPIWMNNVEQSGPQFDPIQKEEACLRWTVAGVQGATISIARLEVPKGARKDFDSACSALKDKKLPAAEDRVRKAIEKYPNYVTAWVMLGQILNTKQQPTEAREACSHALTADANYVPAYLCMADVTYGEGSWDDVLDYSTRALALDPVHDAYGFFYCAAALYNKGDLAKAGRRCVARDSDRQGPPCARDAFSPREDPSSAGRRHRSGRRTSSISETRS